MPRLKASAGYACQMYYFSKNSLNDAIRADQVRRRIINTFFQKVFISRPIFRHSTSRITARLYLYTDPQQAQHCSKYKVHELVRFLNKRNFMPLQGKSPALARLLTGEHGNDIARALSTSNVGPTMAYEQLQKKPLDPLAMSLTTNKQALRAPEAPLRRVMRMPLYGDKRLDLRLRGLSTPLLNAAICAKYLAHLTETAARSPMPYANVFREVSKAFISGSDSEPLAGARISVKGRIQKKRGAGRKKNITFTQGNIRMSTHDAPIDTAYFDYRSKDGIINHRVWLETKRWDIAPVGARIGPAHIKSLIASKSHSQKTGTKNES